MTTQTLIRPPSGETFPRTNIFWSANFQDVISRCGDVSVEATMDWKGANQIRMAYPHHLSVAVELKVPTRSRNSSGVARAEQSIQMKHCRLSQVAWGGRRLKFRRPIRCVVTREDDLYVMEYAPLGIRAYDFSLSAAKNAFNEEFVVIWEDYGKAPEYELGPGGLELKRQLIELVEEDTSSNAA